MPVALYFDHNFRGRIIAQLRRRSGAFAALGYTVAAGPDLAPDGASPERSDYHQVVLTQASPTGPPGQRRLQLSHDSPCGIAENAPPHFGHRSEVASPNEFLQERQ